MPEMDHLKTPGRSNWNRFLGPTATATATATMTRTPNPSDPSVFDSTNPRMCPSRHQPTPTPPWPQAVGVALAPSFQVLTDSASARYQRRIQRLRRCLFRSFLEAIPPPDHRSSSASPSQASQTSPLSLDGPVSSFSPSNPRPVHEAVGTWSPFALGPLGCVSGCPMRTSGGSSLSSAV